MSILCHIILFFYSLLGIGLSIVAAGLYLRVLPDERIWNEFLYLGSRWETLAVIGVYLLFSLYLLLKSLSGKKREVSGSAGETLIVQGKLGEVQVSLEALKDMASKIALSIVGVRDVKVKIKLIKSSNSNTFVPRFDLRLAIGENDNVADISDRLKHGINDYIEKYIGVAESTINITVTTISQTPINGKKRVV